MMTTTTSPRERLLVAACAHVAAHGFRDLSLRELAAAIGTSHRMLLYHFGSREELFVEIVRAFEAQQRAIMTEFIAGADEPATDLMRRVWKQVSAPAAADQVRLFFQVYGQALDGGEAMADALDGIVSDWLEPMVALEQERGTATASTKAEVRLGVAVMRGLLLDLLATGDRRGVNKAFERFITAMEGP
jgi:AcrR family transcriptional regulator